MLSKSNLEKLTHKSLKPTPCKEWLSDSMKEWKRLQIKRWDDLVALCYWVYENQVEYKKRNCNWHVMDSTVRHLNNLCEGFWDVDDGVHEKMLNVLKKKFDELA